MGHKNKMLAAILILIAFCGLLNGCAPLQEKIREYSDDKEPCELNMEDITQFTCKEKSYTILEETVAREKLGAWIGYIRKLAIVDEAGKILDLKDLEQTDIQTLTELAENVPKNAYMVSFLNVYDVLEEENCLIVDVNGGYHKAILSQNVTETDERLTFKNAVQPADSGFAINPENATQLICDGAIYQVTSEVVSEEKLGNYLASLSENVIFDTETKKALTQEERLKIDWSGAEEKQQRAEWLYMDVYEISGMDTGTEVAVKVNNQYHIAKKQ